MAILGALARMRVGPPRNGREPAMEGCTRVPTGAGRSADESGMLGPDAFNATWRDQQLARRSRPAARAALEAMMAQHGFSGQLEGTLESHAKAFQKKFTPESLGPS
jgi:hypothetical protein